MKTEYTVGPWTQTPGQDTIWAKDGDLLVARVHYTRGEMSVNEDEANARLIASAPELLEALMACAEELIANSVYLNGAMLASTVSKALKAKATIAKATQS